jgi:hypothetical protein
MNRSFAGAICAAVCVLGLQNSASGQLHTENGLSPPPDLSPASLAAARGEALRWRDAYRAEHGEMPAGLSGRGWPLPEVVGYFIVFAPAHGGGEFSPGSIVRIDLRDGRSQTGAAMFGNAELVAGGAGVCGTTMAGVNMADVAYLGPDMNPNWVALTRAAFAGAAPLNAGAHARAVGNGQYNVTQSFSPHDVHEFLPAVTGEMDYSADARCGVAADGSLACGVLTVEPQGLGLGWGVLAYATRIGEEIHVGPQLHDGTPSAGTCLELHFQDGGDDGGE